MMTMFIGPPISAALMDYNPWYAMLGGLLIMVLPVPLSFLLPETLHYRPHPPDAQASEQASEHPLWKRVGLAVYHVMYDSASFLKNDLRLCFLVSTFCLHLLIVAGVREILLQYASMQFNISLARSTVLLAVRAGINVFNMLFLLPALSNWLNRRPAFAAHPAAADLILGRTSAICTAAGFLILGISGNLPWFIVGMLVNTMGWGLMVYVRSLALSLIDGHVAARLFSLMGLMDTAGYMLGGPALASLFEIGVDRGGWWTGLPFFLCALFTAFIGVGLAGMALGSWKDANERDNEE